MNRGRIILPGTIPNYLSDYLTLDIYLDNKLSMNMFFCMIG